MKQPLRYWAREVWTYARESRRPRDFVGVMRVRLSLSKVGWLVCPRPIVVDVDLASLGPGIRLRSHTTDISVLSELIVCHGYDAVIETAGDDVATVVDLGANIGLTARWMTARWPDATVVCVEPEPGNVASLRRNLLAAGGAAHVLEACVGASERRAGLRTSTGEHGFAMTEPNGDGLVVDVVTMDRVLASMPPGAIDILKCDIEGAERELFTACRSWIGRVGIAVVECHGDFRGDELLTLLDRNDARFEVAHREVDEAYGLETLTLRRLAGGSA